MANSNSLRTGRRCLLFHLWNVALILVGRDILNIEATMAFQPRKSGHGFFKGFFSKLSTDDSLSLDNTETPSAPIVFLFWWSFGEVKKLPFCTDGKDTG